jgi:hypothetical protein
VFRFYPNTYFEPAYEKPLKTGEGGEPEKQYKGFCAKVSGPVESYTFTDFEGADTHCQVGNPSFAAAVTLDWLDELFD